MSRFPLYNAKLQNDLSGEGFNIRSLNALDAIESNTVYVDNGLPEEIGKVGSSMAFRSIEAAISAAPISSKIVIRPGVYQFDGIIEIRRGHIKIFGYGVTISPITAGEQAGFKIGGNYTELHGIEFDGGLTGSPSNTGATLEIDVAANVLLDGLNIHDQHGSAILLTDNWSGLNIRNCMMTKCQTGIISTAIADDVSDVIISACTIQTMREGGIILIGNDNVNVLNQIRISNNTVYNCDVDGVSAPGIEISGGAEGVLIHGNNCARCFYGIVLSQVLRAEVTANNVFGHNGEMIRLVGNQVVTASSNVLDGSSPATGAPLCPIGISMTGEYAAANDAGPYSITANLIKGILSGGKFIDLANANVISITANEFSAHAYLNLASYDNLMVASNLFDLAGNNPAIVIDAAERGTNRGTILSNHFRTEGTPARLISTVDALSAGHVALHIIGNSSSVGKTYTGGIVGAASGALPDFLSLHANTPVSTERTAYGYDSDYGWVNDEMPDLEYGFLFVSKSGDDSTGAKASKTLRFLTINAAITAASSGDVVVVTDGTYNELIAAKDGVVVRFLPTANLLCTSAGGCLASSANSETFTIYHEHTPIKSSQASTPAVSISHAAIYNIFADIYATGTGVSSHGITSNASASISIFGSVQSTHGNAINSPASVGFPVFRVFPRSNSVQPTAGPHLWSTDLEAIALDRGIIGVEGALILSGTESAIFILSQFVGHTYKRCTIVASATTKAAVRITATGSSENVPIFRDCTLISGATATQSIAASAAQDVTMLGTVMANKGADPPTNVTILGAGIYTVDADVISDSF